MKNFRCCSRRLFSLRRLRFVAIFFQLYGGLEITQEKDDFKNNYRHKSR